MCGYKTHSRVTLIHHSHSFSSLGDSYVLLLPSMKQAVAITPSSFHLIIIVRSSYCFSNFSPLCWSSPFTKTRTGRHHHHHSIILSSFLQFFFSSSWSQHHRRDFLPAFRLPRSASSVTTASIKHRNSLLVLKQMRKKEIYRQLALLFMDRFCHCCCRWAPDDHSCSSSSSQHWSLSISAASVDRSLSLLSPRSGLAAAVQMGFRWSSIHYLQAIFSLAQAEVILPYNMLMPWAILCMNLVGFWVVFYMSIFGLC